MSTQPYSTGTVYWLLAVGVLSFAAAAYFMIYSESDVGAAKANAFSYSAIGHRAFVETLRELDVPVLVSRADSVEKAGDASLLVVAEPRRSVWYEETLSRLSYGGTALLVLPKWDGFPGAWKSYWLRVAGLLPEDYIQSILQEVAPGGSIKRGAEGGRWRSGSLDIEPEIFYPQVMNSALLEPVIFNDDGVLLGYVARPGRTIWVLSDPDILSNHGLRDGDNAALAVRLIDLMRPAGDAAVIFDETVHGYWQPPNLWRSLFQLPFIVPVIIAFAAILVLAWSSTSRFGAPLPAEPPFVPGKTVLIDNTASLLRFGGHGAAILQRYAKVTLRDVARRLNAPRGLDGEALVAWVDRVGKVRGTKRSFAEIDAKVRGTRAKLHRDSPRLARLARRLYQWKREIIDGS